MKMKGKMMSEPFSDGGTALGGSFSEVRRNPNRAEQKVTPEQAKQVSKALAEPRRRVDADDVRIDSAFAAAVDVLTPRRERQRTARLKWEAELLAKEVAKHINQDDFGVSESERAEMDAYLADDDDEGAEEDWSGFASR
jgi:hypothetical protein